MDGIPGRIAGTLFRGEAGALYGGLLGGATGLIYDNLPIHNPDDSSAIGGLATLGAISGAVSGILPHYPIVKGFPYMIFQTIGR